MRLTSTTPSSTILATPSPTTEPWTAASTPPTTSPSSASSTASSSPASASTTVRAQFYAIRVPCSWERGILGKPVDQTLIDAKWESLALAPVGDSDYPDDYFLFTAVRQRAFLRVPVVDVGLSPGGQRFHHHARDLAWPTVQRRLGQRQPGHGVQGHPPRCDRPRCDCLNQRMVGVGQWVPGPISILLSRCCTLSNQEHIFSHWACCLL